MKLGRADRCTRLASVVSVMVGTSLVAYPELRQVMGEWRQMETAVVQDRELPVYRHALRAAYQSMVEDPVVAFERGARPDLRGAPDRQEVSGGLGPPPSAPRASSGAAAASPATSPPPPAPIRFEARIRISAVGLDQAVVEGVTRDALQNGPGHYPGTALPGEVGNVVISGHRTTYTRPFHDLDRLQPGDEIFLDTPKRTVTYLVERVLVADLDDTAALAATKYRKLTLTTCHPPGSARQRLVVEARFLADDLA